MSYHTTAKRINMAMIITMAMVGQRGARNGFLSLTVSLLLAAEYAGFYAVFLL